jgi:ABC-type sulfate transport system permease subunit
MLLFIDRFPWNTLVEDNDQYLLLTDNTFWLSIITAVIALTTAYIFAQIIAYQPDKSDFRARKRMFIFIGLFSLIIFWFYNYFMVSPKIMNDAFNIKFSSLASFGYIYQMLLLIAVIYGIGGFILAKIRKNDKFGTIFP